jgi:hypothetical protein
VWDKDDQVEARPCMNLHGMHRWFGVVPQGLFVFCLFSLFGDFWRLFLEFPLRSFGSISLRYSCWMSHMRTLCLFAWWPCSKKPSETASIWWFSVEFLGRCSWGLTSDSSWLGRFWGPSFQPKIAHEVSQLSPKSHLNPWKELGDRSRWRLSFSRGLSSSRLPRQNRPDRFSPSGLSRGVFEQESLVHAMTFLVPRLKGSWGVLARFGLEGLLGISWKKLADRFAKPAWPASPACERRSLRRSIWPVSETSLTSFWLPAAVSSCFPLRVLCCCWLNLIPRFCSSSGYVDLAREVCGGVRMILGS